MTHVVDKWKAASKRSPSKLLEKNIKQYTGSIIPISKSSKVKINTKLCLFSQNLKNVLQILHPYVRITFIEHIRAFQNIWRQSEGYIQCYIDGMGGKFVAHLGYKIKFTSFLTVLALFQYQGEYCMNWETEIYTAYTVFKIV